MHSLRRASALLFYGLGLIAIIAIVLVERGMWDAQLSVFLNIIDLPLLLFAMLYGGSALATSLSKDEHPSPIMIAVIFVPLAIAFFAFAYFNFALPFPETGF